MPTPAKTLKIHLLELIERHGLAEVLDRLAEVTHASSMANASQLTNLLEQATQLALVEEEPKT